MATVIDRELLTPLYVEGEEVKVTGTNQFETKGIVRVGNVNKTAFPPPIVVDGEGTIANGTVSLNGLVSTNNTNIGNLLRGSIDIPFNSASTSKVLYIGDQPTNRYKIAGLDLDISNLTFRGDEVDVRTGFKLPSFLGGFSIPADRINAQLTMGPDGVSFTGGRIALPETIPINIKNIIKLNVGNAALEFASQPSPFFKLQGKADLELPNGTKATIDLADPNYVQVRDGGLEIVGSFSVENVPIIPKVFEIKSADLRLDTPRFSFDASAKVVLPNELTVGGNLAFKEGLLDAIALEGSNLNIPIPKTPLFLQKISGGLTNLSGLINTTVQSLPKNITSGSQWGNTLNSIVSSQINPRNTLPATVSVGLGMSVSKRISLPLPSILGGTKEGAVADLEGEVSLNAQSISGTVKGYLLAGFVPIASARAELDWVRGTLGLTGTFNISPLIEFNGTINTNTNFDVNAGGSATVIVPDFIPFIGNKRIASANALLNFTNNNLNSDDFAAGWVSLGDLGLNSLVALGARALAGERIGIRVGLDGSNPRVIGAGEIDSLPRTLALRPTLSGDTSEQRRILALGNEGSATFAITTAGKKYLLVNANWTNSASDVSIEVVDPQGKVYRQADFVTGGKVSLIEDLPNPTKRSVAILDPEVGNWTVRLTNSSQLGTIDFKALQDTEAPTVEITNVNYDATNNTATINYRANDPDSVAEVALYYDTNGQGQDGVLITEDLSEGEGSYTFDASGLTTGKYFFYAMSADRENVPTMSYYTKDIDIASAAANAIGKVEDVEADWLGEDSVEVSWQEISGATYYIVSYTKDAAGDSEDPETVATLGNENNIVISDLIPGETYRFWVQAVNEEDVYGLESEAAIATAGDSALIEPAADEWEVIVTPGETYTEELDVEPGGTLRLIDPIPGATLDSATGIFTWLVPTDADGWYEFDIESKNQFGEVELLTFEVLAESNQNMAAAANKQFLEGGGGNDDLDGGSQDNLLMGEQGEDELDGGGGNDSLMGGSGDDFIDSGDGDDFANGGLDADYLLGGKGNDQLFGGEGTDFIEAGEDNDLIYGNQDVDVIFGAVGKDTIYGGKQPDLIFGNQQDDILSGDLGEDTIYGGKDNDSITGGDGDDYLSGDLGNDTIYGNQGNNTLFGGTGNDVIYGGEEEDLIFGGEDADTLFGELGKDTIYGEKGTDLLSGGEGDDQLFGNQDNDILNGNNGNDSLYGGQQNDTLSGDEGEDLLTGDLGSDSLIGGEGDDILMGANNVKSTDAQIDTLTGGTGSDVFMLGDSTASYYTKSGSNDYALITDFDASEDAIALQGLETDYRLATTGLPANIGKGTAIFRILSANQEDLIAIVLDDEQLNLNSPGFAFI